LPDLNRRHSWIPSSRKYLSQNPAVHSTGVLSNRTLYPGFDVCLFTTMISPRKKVLDTTLTPFAGIFLSEELVFSTTIATFALGCQTGDLVLYSALETHRSNGIQIFMLEIKSSKAETLLMIDTMIFFHMVQNQLHGLLDKVTFHISLDFAHNHRDSNKITGRCSPLFKEISSPLPSLQFHSSISR
jgi:hypothetical protein